MTRVKLTACNRCKHTARKDDFEGMNVTIFDQGGTGTSEDQFTLCDACITNLRKWLNGEPSAPPPAALRQE